MELKKYKNKTDTRYEIVHAMKWSPNIDVIQEAILNPGFGILDEYNVEYLYYTRSSGYSICQYTLEGRTIRDGQWIIFYDDGGIGVFGNLFEHMFQEVIDADAK